jgi:pyruvate formate lyase activating enzyme
MVISGIQKFSILDFPGKTACIVFTPGCNFRCKFCYNPEFVLPEEIKKISDDFIPEDVFFNFLEQRKDLLDGVVITGGEPTVIADLPNFMAKIKKKGFLVKLDSNGNKPEVLKDVFDKGLVDYIAMDIKTSLEKYKDLSGADANPDNVKESIELIMKSGIPYEFRSTVVREIHPKEVLKEMAKLIDGADQYFMQAFRPGDTLDPAVSNYQPYDEEEMKNIAKDIFGQYVKKVGIR